MSELTHGQTQIWIGQRLNPESPLYNMAFAFVFPAELRADLFCEAWRRVVDGSDALKTRVVEEGGGARRRMAETGPRTEVLALDPADDFGQWCRKRSARPLPLDGELVDSVLVELGDGRTGWYLNHHHIINDAWSTELLFRQVGLEYEALAGGGGAPVPLSPYYQSASALPSRASERAAALAHWASRRERGGRLARLYGRKTEPVGTASERLTLELDEDRSRGLERLAREDGFQSLSPKLSRFALFATLLVSWLSRVSGSGALGFDAPVVGRPTPDAKRALGLFIEMFPFAVEVSPDETFRSLGAKCLAEAHLFLRHALPGMSAPSGASASNVVLNYFPEAFGRFAGMPVEVEWVHPGHGDSVHALRVQVHDFSGSDRYTLHFDFNEGALPARLRRRGPKHFETIVDAMLEEPDRAIGSVDVLVDEERAALASLNATGSVPLPDRSVAALFRSRASLEPERIALREGKLGLSFGALLAESEALAAALVEHGVEPGDRVAIYGKRSTLVVIAILGALRARAAYVPIDASLPRARVDEIVRDCGARVLLAGESHLSVPGVDVLAIGEAIHVGRGRTIDRPSPGLGDLAYLMYTSGSTGRPKAVLIEHGGLADYLGWASRVYVRGDRLTFPLFTSLGFDLTVTSLFLPLIAGGTLEIYPEPDGPVDAALMDVVEANAVDFIKLTPSHLSLLRRVGLAGSRIRRMVVGGENFPTALAASISAELGDRIEIYNEYGPTEAVVGCMIHRYDPEADTDASVPIGVPVDHVEIEILNEAFAPVPEGVPGELWISRFGLARGYHERDELTAERFRRVSGVRRYRTGDQVRMVDSETLEYFGRVDRQVKVSGFRVEPGEIEAALLSLPTVEQCAVIARRGGGRAPDTSEAVRYCARCGLPSSYPRAVFDDEGVCSVCRSYESIRVHAEAYFETVDDLRALFAESAPTNASEYDCMMLLSGGKDSTYALCRLVEMGLSVYAFTLDNGFISEGAKENIRRVTGELGVPVEIATTPAMNAIFRDSLSRFSNVCNGCFKTIYTLSLARAHELSIPIIVTGLSRGQMFETRLTEAMFAGGRRSPEEIDAAVLAARKVYHRVSDEVTRSLDVSIFDDDAIFEAIRFVDFYRFHDVGMEEMYAYLRGKVPWVRPEDTGRSTNCLINDVGIYVHQQERGFHNYALPYSWDVRLGHKTREAALEELNDAIDVSHVEKTLSEIGYDKERVGGRFRPTTLEAFYVSADEVAEDELRRRLGERLPPQLIPVSFHRVDAIPLTTSGKVDEKALAREALERGAETVYRAPAGPVEEYLAAVWQEELGAERVGADDSFFALGGTSLSAMQVMLRLCEEFDIDLALDTVFAHPKLGELATIAEERILADVSELSPADRRRWLGDAEPLD